MTPQPSRKGTVPFRGHKTWFRVTGDLASGTPVVVAHGGPGSTHDYLLHLAGLAERGHPVVHYDQLGNGGSTHLPNQDPSFWTVDLFLDELDNLLGHLDIAGDYILFGQSWGGLLCSAHAARRPAGLRGLVIANSPASMPIWREETARLRTHLPPDVQAALTEHEQAGTTDSKEYFDATMAFYDEHVCRIKPWPRDVAATMMEIYNDPTVYTTMNGPNEFHVVGSLRDFTVESLLPDIEVPVLVLSGEYDEATPATVQPYQDLIKDVRWEILPGASHMPHVETPEAFDLVLGRFLAEVG